MGKWTRRALITSGVVAGGALVVGIAIRPGQRGPKVAKFVADEGELMVNAWVKIDPDNHITAIVPHSEMGQGAQTALTQMLADELDANWDEVGFIEAPGVDEYANYPLAQGFLAAGIDIPSVLQPTISGAFLQVTKSLHLQITGGSASVRATGVYGMRVAGAAAKQMLKEAAAHEWQVPVDELVTENSTISHKASNKTATYAQFAAAAGAMTPPAKPTLKNPEDFKIMGQSVPRHDIPAKVDGTAMFGIDADVPNMKIATIVAAPVFGATVASVDSSKAESMPGVSQVVQLDDAVAVVADGYWQAKQAAETLDVTWNKSGAESVSSDSIFAQFDADMKAAVEQGNELNDVEAGEGRGAFAGAASVVEATYRVPYLAHSCMEPMNATVAIDGDKAEVWVGSQNPLGSAYSVAEALGIDGANVTIHNQFLGGGFGRRATDDAIVQAAQIAKAAGVPIKLIWSREEDMRHDHYRPAVMSKFKAGLDSNNQPVVWENQYVDKHEPAEAPHIPYKIDNQFIHYADSPTHVPFGPWRSVDHSQHGYFTESFVDELAQAAGKDPLQFRLDLLADSPRHRAVLELAAEKANWGAPAPEGSGRGIALQGSFGSIVAEVVDVTFDGKNVKVDKVVCAVDAGFAVTPDGLTAQMESGIIYGLTAALYGEVSIADGAVAQSNFHDYKAVRMDEAPVIETYIINSGENMGGAGEPGTPGIAPALANAVFDATGNRIRELPLSKYDFSYNPQEPAEVI